MLALSNAQRNLLYYPPDIMYSDSTDFQQYSRWRRYRVLSLHLGHYQNVDSFCNLARAISTGPLPAADSVLDIFRNVAFKGPVTLPCASLPPLQSSHRKDTPSGTDPS